MTTAKNFTTGKILGPLVGFALPVLFALFLQALYGGVDLLIVGQFSETADVSGVATGSMIMQTMTIAIIGLSMGITILVGQSIGEGNPEKAGKAVGGGICLFLIAAVVMTALIVIGAEGISSVMQAPAEAFGQTSEYVRICGIGSVFIVAYNVLGSIFRGMGDSKMPLITVAIACVVNIGGDLLLVAGFDMGAAGAAWATVAAQAISVLISLVIIKRRALPFTFTKKDIRFHKGIVKNILSLGVPIALQDLLVGISFLIIQAIANSMGIVPSAGIGVAEKVCAFIMLIPSAYMQSMSAFVAQNIGAGEHARARKALFYGIATSLSVGIIVGYLTFFHGDLMSAIFTKDTAVIAASHSYLKAYAIDCLLTSFLFCFIGFYNGYGKTIFVMIQGIVGAFAVRVPVAYLMSKLAAPTLFKIGLATPISTVVQITLCLIMFVLLKKVTESKEQPQSV